MITKKLKVNEGNYKKICDELVEFCYDKMYYSAERNDKDNYNFWKNEVLRLERNK